MAKKYKVVYAADHGGFELSVAAINWLSLKYPKSIVNGSYIGNRHDDALVDCVETLGFSASPFRASPYLSVLMVEELEGNSYIIQEYDGVETVIEPKDINWITIE